MIDDRIRYSLITKKISTTLSKYSSYKGSGLPIQISQENSLNYNDTPISDKKGILLRMGIYDILGNTLSTASIVTDLSLAVLYDSGWYLIQDIWGVDNGWYNEN